MEKRFFIVLAFAFLLNLPVRAEKPNYSDFFTSKESFDFSGLGPSDEEVSSLTEKIRNIVISQKILYLDWELRFASSTLDFEDLNCNGRVNENLQPYILPMYLVSTHFLLSVITSSPERYPFNHVSCVRFSGDDFVIRIKGFFTGSAIEIPTANDIELRPLGLYGHLPNQIIIDSE